MCVRRAASRHVLMRGGSGLASSSRPRMAAPFYRDEAAGVRQLETAPMDKKGAANRRQPQEAVGGGGSERPLLTLPSPDCCPQADRPGTRREPEGLVHPLIKGRRFLLGSRDEIENPHPYSLQDLTKQNQHLVLAGAPCTAHTSTSIYHGSLHLTQSKADVPVYTNLGNYNPGLPNAGSESYPTGHVPYAGTASAQHQFSTLAQFMCSKYQEELQTVPEVGPLSESPPLSPLEDGGQHIKAEKKRQRNRIAASNCRRRKLERIARLEDKVKTLKSENFELTSTASVLREQVVHLKHKVMNHVNNGCQVVLASSGLLKPEENGSI
ncbi:transcription factor Jun-like [Pristis pectinata]|uniref:transcription factor Jun-like n=1 Tax=Pristis pectinata TaxID=685728 RepID=UPI00223E166E|nr:transcription factor Jun-like [Pristis pectinata]